VALDELRELVEDLGAYVVQHRYEKLRPYIEAIEEAAARAVESGLLEHLERQLLSTHFQGMRAAVGATSADPDDRASWEQAWKDAGHKVPSRFVLAVVPCMRLLFRTKHHPIGNDILNGIRPYNRSSSTASRTSLNGTGAFSAVLADGKQADAREDGNGDDVGDGDDGQEIADDTVVDDVEEEFIDDGTKYLRRLARRAA